MSKNIIPVCGCGCRHIVGGEAAALWSDLRLGAVKTVMERLRSGDECQHEATITDRVRATTRCIFCGHTWAVS